MNIDILKNAGIDVDGGLSRCMGKTALYEKLMKMFLVDPSMETARAAIGSGSGQELFRGIHTLKGVAGNLSLTPLYNEACELTEVLRPGNYDMDDVKTRFAHLEATYAATADAIRAALEA